MKIEYQKPELKKYGNLEDITKASQIKGMDGSDSKSSAS
jgi:hypothetical protein